MYRISNNKLRCTQFSLQTKGTKPKTTRINEYQAIISRRKMKIGNESTLLIINTQHTTSANNAKYGIEKKKII